MTAPARTLQWTAGIGLLLLLGMLALVALLAGYHSHRGRVTAEQLPVYNAIPDFSLTNQTGSRVTLGTFKGGPWVADIIFTRCPGPCARMTGQMKELQDALATDTSARLVSLTTDPDFDAPPVLEKYAHRFGADTNRWTFLTGTKAEIGNLALNGLKLGRQEVKPEERTSPNDLWVHSTIFVVVDKQARLRGVFETGGEDVEWPVQKQKILAAVKQLEREP
jgi:protein SCO1/2